MRLNRPTEPSLLSTLWRFRSYGRPHRRLLALGVLCRTGELLADLAVPWPIALVVDGVLGHGKLHGLQGEFVRRTGLSGVGILVVAAVASLVFTLLSGMLDYLGDRLMNGAGERITANIRCDVFSQLLRLPMTFHDRRSVGELTSRMSSDTNRIEDCLVDVFSTLLPGVMTIVGLSLVITALDWRLGLVALSAAPLVFLAAQRYSRLTREAARARRAAEGQLAAITAETITGIKTVHVAGTHDVHEQEFARFNGTALRAGLRSVDLRARFTPLLEGTSAFGTAGLLLVGGYGAMQGWWTAGTLVVALAYFRDLLRPLRSMARLSLTLSTGAASAERVAEILDVPAHGRPTRTPSWIEPSVRLDHVSLDYGRGPVLTDIDLDVPAGGRLALSGANGAGKSSVLALIAGLYHPSAGRVLIGGHDVQTLDNSFLRSQVSVVLQDTFLFSGSVFENVLMGKPDASPHDVAQACAAAGVLDFTDELPDGLSTALGDRGVGLSGGQRQRVGIARALLRDSPIVLLDEPTSGLDVAAEQALIEAFKTLMDGRTVIMTTHRPALLSLADHVETLREGRLVASEPSRSTPGDATRPRDHRRVVNSPDASATTAP